MTMNRALGAAGAVLTMGAATVVVTWWLVGDLTIRGYGTDLDYAVRPPHWSAAAVRWAGVSALLVLLAGLVLLGAGSLRRWFPWQWWVVMALLVISGAVIGYSGRVATAGVIGANIGEGLAVLLFGPIAAGLTLGALVQAVVLLRREWTGGRP
ncbi:hypothetical protein V2S66_24085 [Streptomyces sp. V4-01]|uniref:Uncharacterized protein n=1 Tax=Actinacidiphila polyblastidii TaxID=3110430 RepID=A0ABU7PGU6_9ACTN|nr:hypothetical protein [Streptomyces sp. V4-01]